MASVRRRVRPAGRALSVRHVFGGTNLKSLDAWINALGDPDWRVRRRAVEHLLQDTGENSLEQFIRKVRLEHRDASILNSVLQVLTSLGSEALPGLEPSAKMPIQKCECTRL